MARAHGMSGYAFAVIAHDMGVLEDLRSKAELETIVEHIVPQIVQGLTGREPLPARSDVAPRPHA